MDEKSFQLWPDIASTFAFDVDLLYGFLLAVSAFFTVLICAMVIGFSIYFRRGNKVNRKLGHHSNFTEVIWASVPFVLVMIMFVWGAFLFYKMQTPPENTLDIQVVGKQWMWKIQHPTGRQEINSLHVPLGQPVRLRMISEDVIHSFYVPAFRVKQDVLPAYFTQLWFEATKVGKYHLFCAEYCGNEHSMMIGTVTVLDPEEYSRWAQEGNVETPSSTGEKLFSQFQCSGCHREDGTGNGPSLAGIAGKMRPLKGGGAVEANDQYLRDSILNPHRQILSGFDAMMPSFQGQLTESDSLAIIAYLKSLSKPVVQPNAVTMQENNP